MADTLTLRFPQNVGKGYWLHDNMNYGTLDKFVFGKYPSLIPGGHTVSYRSADHPVDRAIPQNTYVTKYTDGKLELEEYVKSKSGKDIIKRQELTVGDGLSVKTNRINRKGYSATHIKDAVAGTETVVYRNGKKVIGSYDMPLAQKGFSFGQGIKGELEKFALKIGTKPNGCERPILRRLAGFIFDIACRIK